MPFGASPGRGGFGKGAGGKGKGGRGGGKGYDVSRMWCACRLNTIVFGSFPAQQPANVALTVHHPVRQEGPPDRVEEVGSYMHECEGEMVIKLTHAVRIREPALAATGSIS